MNVATGRPSSQSACPAGSPIMECPQCSADTAVIDSRTRSDNSLRRRRRCLNRRCSHRFTTTEIILSEVAALSEATKLPDIRAILKQAELEIIGLYQTAKE